MLEKYHLGELVIEVFNDPLLGDEGDITETRDYQTYRQAFEDGAERKYRLIAPHIKGGRIVDIGCATGSIIRMMSKDKSLVESDIYGIEASRKLYDICEQNRQDGYFSNENVFFYQRNIMTGTIFPDNSIDTTTTLSLTHSRN
jgi:ubiquinone/menaquinone biosynthesis C-methylase UbiE